MSLEIISGAAAFLLTLMILSYLVGDNPAFRVAVHLFVGVAAGYVAAVALWQVLLPKLILPLVVGTAATRAMLAIPLLLCGMILMKAWPSLTRLGAPAMGLLVGVGSALAIGGAIQGTLFPQIAATIDLAAPARIQTFEGLLNGAIVLVGVIASAAYFQFSARLQPDGSVRRIRPLEILAGVGGVFLAITLGVLFAGVYSAALTAFIERLLFIINFVGLG
ncbi:MAG TPA: hypothetical protein VIU38_01550 [Anaerolineales bacterium]